MTFDGEKAKNDGEGKAFHGDEEREHRLLRAG